MVFESTISSRSGDYPIAPPVKAGEILMTALSENEAVSHMNALPGSEWNQSHWFKEWLFMARDREMSNGKTAFFSPEHKFAELQSESAGVENWSYSEQENAALTLPRIKSKTDADSDAFRYMDTPHAFA